MRRTFLLIFMRFQWIKELIDVVSVCIFLLKPQPLCCARIGSERLSRFAFARKCVNVHCNPEYASHEYNNNREPY